MANKTSIEVDPFEAVSMLTSCSFLRTLLDNSFLFCLLMLYCYFLLKKKVRTVLIVSRLWNCSNECCILKYNKKFQNVDISISKVTKTHPVTGKQIELKMSTWTLGIYYH